VRVAWLVFLAYATWFGASVLTQRWTPRFVRLVQRFDILRLSPTWQLFRSPPLHAALVWRDQLDDRTCTDWQTVSMVRPSTWLAPLWNPQMYRPQLLYALVIVVAASGQVAPSRRQELEASFAHRALWHYISRLPRSPQSVARQFQVLVSDDQVAAPVRSVYRSALHPLSDHAGPAWQSAQS
jgi:hypothetical protein